MSLGIDNDKRFYLVCIQKLNNAVVKFKTFSATGFKGGGHIVINNYSALCTVIKAAMIPQSMHHAVFILAVQFFAINNFVTGVFGFSKFFRLGGDKNDILAMDILVHVRIEVMNQILTRKTRCLPAD